MNKVALKCNRLDQRFHSNLIVRLSNPESRFSASRDFLKKKRCGSLEVQNPVPYKAVEIMCLRSVLNLSFNAEQHNK
jgi:hypothetical protein